MDKLIDPPANRVTRATAKLPCALIGQGYGTASENVLAADALLLDALDRASAQSMKLTGNPIGRKRTDEALRATRRATVCRR
jgi:hypothetical protein